MMKTYRIIGMFIGAVLAAVIAFLQISPADTQPEREVSVVEQSDTNEAPQFVAYFPASFIPASVNFHIQYEPAFIATLFEGDAIEWKSFVPEPRVNPIRAFRVLFRFIIAPNAP